MAGRWRRSKGQVGRDLPTLTPHLLAQVKMAYVNFVNHCYVDTEVEMKEIYTSNHIWTLFESFTLDMARVRLWGLGLWADGRGLPGAGGGAQASVSLTPGLQQA